MEYDGADPIIVDELLLTVKSFKTKEHQAWIK
jgi:hypothetical protein